MKVEKQLPVVTSLDTQERRAPVLPDASTARPRKAERKAPSEAVTVERPRSKGTGFNLQLNQQLSSMQSAEKYLDDLTSRLRQLKLTLSRELSAAQGTVDRDSLKQAMQQVNRLLGERSQRTAGTLDGNFKLRLAEPVRTRFSIDGLDSLQSVQQSGKETLLFNAGRQSSEPIAVVMEEGMSAEQLLRRFNATLGQIGIRAEADAGGELKFSAREDDWQNLRGQLSVKGEGKLFATERYEPVQTHEESLLSFPDEIGADTYRELRRVLDSVVAALDRVGAIRDQLSHRQQEIRDFLARQTEADESQWARDYAGQVFNLMQRSPSSYASVTQTVVAQANISRYSVVSLLS